MQNIKIIQNSSGKNRSIFEYEGIEFVTGIGVNYVEMKPRVLELIKNKGLNELDINKLAVFLNISAYNSVKPCFKYKNERLDLDGVSKLFGLKKADIKKNTNEITIARIARCLIVECFGFLEKNGEVIKGVLPLKVDSLSFGYRTFNSYLILPSEDRVKWLDEVKRIEEGWEGSNKRFSTPAEIFFNSNVGPLEFKL